MFQNEFQIALDRDQNQSLPVSNYYIDDFMEKLKLLNYENALFKEIKIKPLSRYYFMKSVNPGEQFFVFTSICAWLIRKTGRNFEQPQEFDDPSQVISKIIKILQEMDIPTDFPSNKLIQGAGPISTFVLDCLASQALKIAGSHFLHPEIKQEEDIPNEIFENDSEIILEKVEEEQNAIATEDSDDERNSMLDLKENENKNKFNMKAVKFDSLADSESWRLELERVLPQLKIVVKSDPRDWRSHLEQMKLLRNNIESASDDTKTHLKKLEMDITFVMEKVESREKHLNNDLKALIQNYKSLSNELNQVNNLIKENEEERQEKEQELTNLINDLENVKLQMEQRGNSMTDGSPLINIKKTISNINDEIDDMNLQIGVLEHTLNADLIRQLQYIEIIPMRTIL